MHAGHYVPASRGNATYFDERNVNCQCYHCNINLSGNAPAYTLFLIRKYGPQIIEELNAKGATVKVYSKSDYIDLRTYYEGLSKELELWL